ncbi:MAG: flagellar hook-associated protein FlgL [Desulfatirhabdiaceae bacterium]
MRITQTMISSAVQKHVSTNAERLFKTQEMISSGKRIVRPSDDPLGMSQVMNYRKALSSIDQYQRNIGQGTSELEQAESALNQVGEVLMRAKELALAQNTGTASPETRKIAATELIQLRDQLVQLANTKIGDRYLFGGLKTDAPPYDTTDPSIGYQGDDGEFQTIIGEGVTLITNANGKQAFSRDADAGKVLSDLITGLEDDDSSVIESQLAELDKVMNQAVDARADIGAKINRTETTALHWESVRFNIEKNLSETEDTDITQAIMDLTSQETAYQASLTVSARTFQQSLLDFLR